MTTKSRVSNGRGFQPKFGRNTTGRFGTAVGLEVVKKPEAQVDDLIMTPKIERILVEGFKLWCRMNADDLESAFASLRRLCKGEPD